MFPTSLPGGRPSGITAARPTSAVRREAGQVRHRRGLQRRASAERVDGLVGTSVGHEHHVLHGLHAVNAAPKSRPSSRVPRARPGRVRRPEGPTVTLGRMRRRLVVLLGAGVAGRVGALLGGGDSSNASSDRPGAHDDIHVDHLHHGPRRPRRSHREPRGRPRDPHPPRRDPRPDGDGRPRGRHGAVRHGAGRPGGRGARRNARPHARARPDRQV